jgi:hypothetical protein
MKKIALAVLTAVLCTSLSFAVSLYGTANLSKNTKITGKNYVESVTLTNPCTDYAGYDFYTTTDTAGVGSAKVLIQSVIVPTKCVQTFVIAENYSKPFVVSMSTVAQNGAYDGGLDHALKIKYSIVQ